MSRWNKLSGPGRAYVEVLIWQQQGPYDHMCDAFALKNLGKSSEKSVVA